MSVDLLKMFFVIYRDQATGKRFRKKFLVELEAVRFYLRTYFTQLEKPNPRVGKLFWYPQREERALFGPPTIIPDRFIVEYVDLEKRKHRTRKFKTREEAELFLWMRHHDHGDYPQNKTLRIIYPKHIENLEVQCRYCKKLSLDRGYGTRCQHCKKPPFVVIPRKSPRDTWWVDVHCPKCHKSLRSREVGVHCDRCKDHPLLKSQYVPKKSIHYVGKQVAQKQES